MGKTFFQIQRISSPSTASSANNIFGNQAIAARVAADAPGFDTHNCYNPGQGSYTIPVDGYYRIDTSIGSQQESQMVYKRAGDRIEVNILSFRAGEWLLSLDKRCIGTYDGANGINVLDGEDSNLNGTRIPVDLYRVAKIPENSTYKSAMVLFGTTNK